MRQGSIFGLTPIHTKAHMLRAIMEGVSFSLKDCMEIIKEMNIDVNEVRASGGGGKSPLWRQMQADMFNSEVATINSSEGPALGVSILAGVGAGIYKNVEEVCDSIIKVFSKQNPIDQNACRYNKYYEIYKALYPCLKEQYKVLSQI